MRESKLKLEIAMQKKNLIKHDKIGPKSPKSWLIDHSKFYLDRWASAICNQKVASKIKFYEKQLFMLVLKG